MNIFPITIYDVNLKKLSIMLQEPDNTVFIFQIAKL
jgi:hypothetical protein